MDINLERKELEKIYGKISPFEFKNQLIDLAETSQKKAQERFWMLDVEIQTGLPLPLEMLFLLLVILRPKKLNNLGVMKI